MKCLALSPILLKNSYLQDPVVAIWQPRKLLLFPGVVTLLFKPSFAADLSNLKCCLL